MRQRVLAALYHQPSVVGCVAVGLMLGTAGLFSISVDVSLLVAGFSGTTLAYMLDRVWARSPEDAINHPLRVRWVESHLCWLAVETVLLFAVAGASVFFLNWKVQVGTLVLGGVALFHVWPQGTGFIQRRGMTKPLIIAAAWAVGGTLLPLLEAGIALWPGFLLFVVYRFLYILPNLLLSDWTDRRGDTAAGLNPWARRWTHQEVRWMATTGLAFALIGAGVWASVGVVPLLVGIDAVGLVLMTIIVWAFDLGRLGHAFLSDLVVGWPAITFVAAWMMV